MVFTTDSQLKAGSFLSRDLEQRLPRVLEKRYPSLVFENGTLIPTKVDLQPGAQELVQDIIELVGRAEINADEAFDIPMADAAVDEEKFPIVMVFSAFHYTWRQVEAAQYANVPLRDRKMMAARRAIAERMDEIACFGAAKHGFSGFLNNANVTVSSPTTNPHATTTTTDQLIAFFVDEVTRIVSDTELTEEPNVALVTPYLHEELVKRTISGTDSTIKRFILENNIYLKDIRPVTNLKSALLEEKGVHTAGTNKDRMVIYPLSDEILERHISSLRALPTEYKDAKWKTPMCQATSPTIVNFPKSMVYVDYAKKV